MELFTDVLLCLLPTRRHRAPGYTRTMTHALERPDSDIFRQQYPMPLSELRREFASWIIDC
jgi:hypothetical protein